jgi:hypothetical protein
MGGGKGRARRAGGFPAACAAGIVGSPNAEGGQAVEDFFDVGQGSKTARGKPDCLMMDKSVPILISA